MSDIELLVPDLLAEIMFLLLSDIAQKIIFSQIPLHGFKASIVWSEEIASDCGGISGPSLVLDNNMSWPDQVHMEAERPRIYFLFSAHSGHILGARGDHRGF
jgi:hypothetical protein